MGSYNTVQVVAWTPVSNLTDYVILAPGYTFSLNSVAPAAVAGGPSSGTSFTPTSELSFGVPVAGNVLMGLPYIVAASTGLNVTYDKTGRITSTAASIDTTLVTGVWTSGVSSGNVQGLGSTWTVSRISSAVSILGNEVWASGVSVLSITTTSRISSSASMLGNDIWASGLSASAATASNVSYLRQLGRGLVADGSALIPSIAFSSETSLGFYRSANSTLRQSYGTMWPTTVWIDSGLSMIGSTASMSGLNVASTISCSGLTVSSIATVSRLSSSVSILANEVWASGMSVGSITTSSRVSSSISVLANEIWSSGVSAKASIGSFSYTSSSRTGMAVEFWSSGISAIASIGSFSYTSSSRTGMAVEFWSSGVSAKASIGSFSYISSSRTEMAVEFWGSGLSIGNATAGGTLIPAISSMSSKIGSMTVRGSASSFTIVTWTAVQPGDIITQTIFPDAAVSSLSSGLVMHSHCTKAGQFEFRLSNVSTLAQSQSVKTYYFMRVSPF